MRGFESGNPEEQLSQLPHSQTIYHSLMSKEEQKTGAVPTAVSLYEEAQALVFAGVDTVGHALMVGTYHMLKSPSLVMKLKIELTKAILRASDSPSIRDLEKLPYLTACVEESLRMASGVISGFPRIVPPEGALIDGVRVPGGTIVSIGSTFVHYNAEIFPSPNISRPEHWLENPGLDNWLLAFGRGPRMCLGISFAWVELYLAMATLFRRFDMVSMRQVRKSSSSRKPSCLFSVDPTSKFPSRLLLLEPRLKPPSSVGACRSQVGGFETKRLELGFFF